MSDVPYETFTRSRVAGVRAELLTVDGAPLGDLNGITGGSITRSVATTVREGGTIDLVDVDDLDAADWLASRVRVWYEVEGYTWPLGTFVPSTPREAWGDYGRRWEVQLLGRLTTLAQDEAAGSYTVGAGTVVTDAVRTVIAGAGQQGTAITDSTATLPAAMVWEPGTSRLRIINDLLDAIGYGALSCDGMGTFRAGPYTRPAARPLRYELLDGHESIYRAELTRDRDIFAVPNRVVCIGVAEQDVPALVGVAENTDPNSPFYPLRRGQWVTHTEEGVEASSQAVLDAYARRRLIELTSVTSTLDLDHVTLPLDLGDVLRIRRAPAGIDARFTVQSQTIPLDPLALSTCTLREVVDL